MTGIPSSSNGYGGGFEADSTLATRELMLISAPVPYAFLGGPCSCESSNIQVSSSSELSSLVSGSSSELYCLGRHQDAGYSQFVTARDVGSLAVLFEEIASAMMPIPAPQALTMTPMMIASGAKKDRA